MEKSQESSFKDRLDDVFRDIAQITDIAALSKEDRMKYDESIKVYRDQLAVMTFERQQGRAEGEHRAQLRIARRMKEAGLSAEQIMQMTGLTMDEVEALD